jgi:hypothetical protein
MADLFLNDRRMEGRDSGEDVQSTIVVKVLPGITEAILP